MTSTHPLLGRFPLAKQRLALAGPTEEGTDGTFSAALAIAAEARAQGAGYEDALALIQRMPLPRESRRFRKQAESAAHFAYNTPNGLPILSGCCKDPRPRSGNPNTSRLRRTFQQHCDDECERTCPMLRAIRNPSRSLHTTPYQAADDSNLWVHGAGLGQAGRFAYQIIAQLALALGTQEVQASGRYLAIKSGGMYDDRHFRKVTAALAGLGLIEKLDRKGNVRIPTPTPERIAALERELGVVGRREATVAAARRASQEYEDWLAQELSKNGDEEAMDAWNPAPPEETQTEKGRAAPTFLQSWNGLTSREGG